MVLRSRIRRQVFQVLGPVLAAILVGYFAFYTVEGERGLIVLKRLEAQAAQEGATLHAVKSQRQALEAKVVSLRPDSLDLDRLDERARLLLNNSRPNELIINFGDAAQ